MQRPRSDDSQIDDRVSVARPRLYAYLALVVAALAWAGNVVVGRDIRDQYGPV